MCAMPLLTRESTHEIIALHRSAIENSNEVGIMAMVSTAIRFPPKNAIGYRRMPTLWGRAFRRLYARQL